MTFVYGINYFWIYLAFFTAIFLILFVCTKAFMKSKLLRSLFVLVIATTMSYLGVYQFDKVALKTVDMNDVVYSYHFEDTSTHLFFEKNKPNTSYLERFRFCGYAIRSSNGNVQRLYDKLELRKEDISDVVYLKYAYMYKKYKNFEKLDKVEYKRFLRFE